MLNIKKRDKLKKLWKKIKFELKLHMLDSEWRSSFVFSELSMYPPSFYVKHTKEEIERIKRKDRKFVLDNFLNAGMITREYYEQKLNAPVSCENKMITQLLELSHIPYNINEDDEDTTD